MVIKSVELIDFWYGVLYNKRVISVLQGTKNRSKKTHGMTVAGAQKI